MMRTILVPLDGSALSERALPYAATLARAAAARLVLVRAVLAHTFVGADPSDAQIALREQAEAYLDSVAEPLRLTGLTVDPHVYYDEAVAAILDLAEAQHADQIVMSTHGRTGLGRWVYGSVADQVLRRSVVPVLLVPAGCDVTWPTAEPPRIVVPLDGSPLAEEALGPARALAAALGAEMLLLQVLEFPLPLLSEGAAYAAANFDQDAELATATAYLEPIAADLRANGQSAAVKAVVSPPAVVGQAVSTIVEVAAEEGAAAIALATHGRGGLARLMLGSVATGVIHRAGVPLLLVRPAQAHQAAAASHPALRPEVADPPATITLNARERAVVRQGLATLLGQAASQPPLGGEDAGAAAALLARLAEYEPAAPTAAVC